MSRAANFECCASAYRRAKTPCKQMRRISCRISNISGYAPSSNPVLKAVVMVLCAFEVGVAEIQRTDASLNSPNFTQLPGSTIEMPYKSWRTK